MTRPPRTPARPSAGTVESWLRGELPQMPEELTRRIDVMFQDYIRGVALRLKAPAAVHA